MNRKKIIVICLLAISTILTCYAQNITQTVRGTVTDKDTKAPLIGAIVVVLNSNPLNGTATDINGEFVLKNIPVGRQSFQVTLVGYKKYALSDLEVNSGKELVLNINLEESVTELNEVTVTGVKNKTEGINDMSNTSTRTFSIEETGRYAGSRNDVSRMATNYAGVTNADDSRNDIVIRGNSPSGLLWRLEEMEIPSPNHFTSVGSSGGPVSMLNYNVIANSDFMSGAFPAEFGNATSGVFDIKLRNGNNSKREYMVQFGAMGTEAMLEGPFSRNYKGSYLVNYRFSTTSILRAMNVKFGYDGRADYQDLSYNFNLPLSDKSTLTLFGLGGKSYYESLHKSDDIFPEDQYFNSSTGVSGLTFMQRIGKETYFKTIFGVSGVKESFNTDSVYIPNNEIIPNYKADNYQSNYTSNTYIKSKLNSKNKFQIGLNLDNNAYHINTKIIDYQTMQLQPFRTGSGNAWLIQPYSQLNHSFTDNLSIIGGLHFQYFGLNHDHVLEPRLSLKWKFLPSQSLTFGYGLHSQTQLLPLYLVVTNTAEGEVNTNKNLKFSKSNQFVIGYSYLITQNTALKLETYYQDLYDIPIDRQGKPTSFSVLNEGMSFHFTGEDSLVNNGTGRNLGLELTLERFFNKGYYYLITGSLFDSKYKGSNGVLHNTAYNGVYVLNMLAGKEFKTGEKSKLIVDIKISTAGGKHYTPIDREASSMAGYAIYDENEAFSKQFKTYFRTDFKLTYRFNGFGKTQEFFINIDNVFNNQNVLEQFYNPKSNKLEYEYQLGIFPTFQYKIFF